ncbi:GntR family transcriptional regulator [Streptomyces sp. NBC_00572]|uniref:GntR family transcriptional regulator n=1 Tax=Streptomyces sp. NBC_00572 TaxID=2903664 RepID=UPI0022581726|nr:GntR family transcriptional regulator [Streptomyces sp. NBC_00572]MCX4985896.1 GntR family transcriptional regulator [Streptomyces sp. NBC_00572]
MSASVLPKVTRRGLADEAADLVRDAIFAGRFPPGAQLREVGLAEELGISRGSVRDGLAQLEKEGLVRSGWHRSTTVIDVTPHDVQEVYDLRAALDRLAAITARRAGTEAGLDELDSLIAAMEEKARGGASDSDLAAADLAFHDQIYRMAGNARLTAAWHTIRSQIRLFHLCRIADAATDYRARVVEEHRKIADLLRGDDEPALTEYVQEHVDIARRALLATME